MRKPPRRRPGSQDAGQPVFGYVRVSTDKQDLSPDVQEKRIRAWAEFKGLEIRSIHQERQSGKSADDRAVLQEVLAAVCAAKGVLVVVKLDRLSRSIVDAAKIIERLDESGADLVSLTEGLVDTTTANGKLIFRFFCMIAEFERDQISERTQVVLDAKRERGEYLGNTPWGYRRGANGMLEPDEAEQRAVACILGVWGKYRSLSYVVRELNRQGHRARSLPWNAGSVDRALRGKHGPDAQRDAEAARTFLGATSDKRGRQAIGKRLNELGTAPPPGQWSAGQVRRILETYAPETLAESCDETADPVESAAAGA